jgi:hypothetical protein
MRRLAPAAARLAFLIRFAYVTSAGGRGSRLLVALGVAAGAAVLVGGLGASAIGADAELARSLRAVPASERSVQVAHFGIAREGATYRDLDRTVAHALAPLALGPPVRLVQYRAMNLGRGEAVFAAVGGLERWVRVASGRLPRRCTPERCEVLRVGGRGPDPVVGGFPLIVVGSGSLASQVPFARLLGVDDGTGDAVTSRDRPPLLLADGVEVASAFPQLAHSYRSYAWVFPLGALHPWQADSVRERLVDAQATLSARSFAFQLDAPTGAIEAATRDARVAARRLLIVGGQAAGLLLAFTVLAAAALRRELLGVRRRLTWFGARRRQIAFVLVADLGAVAVTAGVVGWLVAAGACAAIARRAGVPVGPLLGHSLATTTGLVAVAAVVSGATVALVATVYSAGRRPSARRITAVDLAAAGALATLLLALSRGAADPRALANERGSVALVLLLPALALFVAAAVAARILAPALVALARPAARSPTLGLRLPILALARNSGRASIAVGFLVVSVGGALFALAYRATLERGVRDRVHYAFPLDFVLREDMSRSLVRPLDVAPLERYRKLGEHVEVVTAIRRHAQIPTLAGGQALTMLAVPARRLQAISGWRDDFSSLSLARIAGHLAPGKQVALRGARIPADATALSLTATTRGDPVGIEANIANGGGDFTAVDLGVVAGERASALYARLPAKARGGRLVALSLNRALGVEGHAKGNVPIVEGTLRLGPLVAEAPAGPTTLLTRYPGWRGDGDVSPLARGDRVRLRYRVTSDTESRFRPRQPLDGEAVPVVASPAIAAAADEDGRLSFRLAGGDLTAKVVATARYFPSLYGSFVVADEATFFSALNTRRPGAAVPSEVWLGAPGGDGPRLERLLRAPPFDALALGTRSGFEAELENDPLARGTIIALTATAIAALGLALLGLVLLVRGDLSDERGELFDLEAQGADPRLLTFHLRARVAVVALLGALAGLVAGTALTGLVVSVVTVTAGGTAGVPPLALVLDWRGLALALVLFVIVVGGIVVLTTRRAFAAPFPTRTAA